jgi:predicted O-methyltransferase YrrM
MSALALTERLPADGRVVTFDVVPWREVLGTLLTEADFADGRLEQVVDDVTHADGLARHRELLTRADLLFVDAAKDGSMEARLLAHLESVPFERPPIVVLDDIRLWKMLDVWRSISRPKLDLTSFGHWSGTGLVDWS